MKELSTFCEISCSAIKSIVYNWMADFEIFQNVPDFVLVIITLLFLYDFYKLGIKISRRYICSWCSLICTILFGFWNPVTFTSGKELFLTSLCHHCQCHLLIPCGLIILIVLQHIPFCWLGYTTHRVVVTFYWGSLRTSWSMVVSWLCL